MDEKKFFMRDKQGNYASGIATYVTNLYDAKIFEGNPKDYEKYENEIILVNSKKGLELIAKEMELLDKTISQEESRLNEMKKGRENLYKSTSAVREYIQKFNESMHPLMGVSEERKQKIIEEICIE